MAKIILGHWDLRARAEVARMMLEYSGVDFEDKRYCIKLDSQGNFDKSDFAKVKYSLDLDFPNLPYLIDGEVRLSESYAIYRYLAKKCDLRPITDQGGLETDMLAGVLSDLLWRFVSAIFNSNFKDMRNDFKAEQKERIKQIEDFLEGRQFATGTKLTFIDFVIYEEMDWHRLLLPDIFYDMPNIRGFLERFASLDKIAAYFKSDRYKKFPIVGPGSVWGGKDHDDRTW